MAINYTALNTEGLAKQIASSIKDAILEGALKVDERLPTEEELSERFGVSRPTVREALKRLAAQNLIHTRRGPSGGSFVKKPSLEDIRGQISSMAAVLLSLGEFNLFDIAEARHELERVCCRLAASRCSTDVKCSETQLADMEVELGKQRNPEITDVEFCASDVRFHCLMVDATQNPLLRLLMEAVLETLQPVLNLVVYKFRERPLIVQQHQAIYDAIKNGDPERAVAALDSQMEYLRQKYAVARDTSRQKREKRAITQAQP